ncbi:HNH endonuclease [Clostridium sp. CT7]|uniref:HNH endonuclease n=2 Tax=Clostridium TaxID=1485 RepID=UPI0012FD98AE|nr:HNH endonuclease [Clostridium sp. CT7]
MIIINKQDRLKFTKQFTKLLLKITKENDVGKAIYKLFRITYIEKQREYNVKYYTSIARAILNIIKDSDNKILENEIYNEENITTYVTDYIEHVGWEYWNEHIKNPILDERKKMINDILGKYRNKVYSKYNKLELRNIFIENVTLYNIKYDIEYFENKFKLKPEGRFENEAYIQFLDEVYSEFKIYDKDRIDLACMRYGSKLKQIILSMQDNYYDKDIAEKLCLTPNLYKKVRSYLGFTQTHKPKNKNIFVKINLDKYNDRVFQEGKRYLTTHKKIERNPKVIKLSKELFKKEHGKLYCEVCNTDFYAKYGDWGKDYIEGHHENPLSEFDDMREVNIREIRMLCSNCHRMIHRNRKKCLTVEELKNIFVGQKEKYDKR